MGFTLRNGSAHYKVPSRSLQLSSWRCSCVPSLLHLCMLGVMPWHATHATQRPTPSAWTPSTLAPTHPPPAAAQKPTVWKWPAPSAAPPYPVAAPPSASPSKPALEAATAAIQTTVTGPPACLWLSQHSSSASLLCSTNSSKLLNEKTTSWPTYRFGPITEGLSRSLSTLHFEGHYLTRNN